MLMLMLMLMSAARIDRPAPRVRRPPGRRQLS
jgi:hypothetical protein